MTEAEYEAKPAIDHLRNLVRNFDALNESFNQRFVAVELVAIHRAWMLCGWDFAPSAWTDWQVRAAIHGVVPEWDDNEKPVRVSP